MPKPGTLPEAPKPKAEAATESTPAWAIELDGVVYEGRSTWSWRDEKELYDYTGLGWPRIVAEMRRLNTSPFFIGCLVFLSRRGDGDLVSFEDVQAAIDADSQINLNVLTPVEKKPTARRRKDPAPEDQGSS